MRSSSALRVKRGVINAKIVIVFAIIVYEVNSIIILRSSKM